MGRVMKAVPIVVLCALILVAPSVWAYWVQDDVAFCTVTGSQYFSLIISDGAGGAEPAPRSSSDWSDASTPEYPRISALLFPETKSWALVSAMKAADSTYLRANEGRLRAAYLSTDFGKGDREHGHDCSVIERLFDTGFGFPKGFYVHDADLDGREDVIYSGDAKVVEGHWTMVWFGTDSGFVMREGTIQHVLALRMKEGDPPQFSSVEVGCCDDPIDGYFVGTLVDARANLKSVVSYTRFPSRAEKPAGFVGSAGMSLRYSPELEDGYAGPGTTHVGDPAYGNILSVCGTQRTGTIVGRETDKSSRLWYFVVLDEACTDPLRVNVGWVEAGAVSLKK